jgi:deferrochelatase/peroxidase EfeB
VAGALGGDPLLPPEDTGETMDLPASGLTITIGFGPGLFERDGVDRFGIGAGRPSELVPLPAFTGDAIDPALSDGDFGVQICADDPLVALHAMRNFARVAFGRAAIRWSQTGFGGATKGTSDQPTPRNLLGFKDGTSNIDGADQTALDEHVWLPADSSPGWLAGGTYLVVRRIAMLLEGWDGEPLSVQQATFGRTKGDGAPLSGGDESTPPDFNAKVGGAYAIDPHAHIRLAHPSNNGGIRLLRRGYSYFDGTTADGRLDGGLLFMSYQHSPERFVTVQRALATDLLNDFIRPVGSALFAVPPGASTGGYVGETLIG